MAAHHRRPAGGRLLDGRAQHRRGGFRPCRGPDAQPENQRRPGAVGEDGTLFRLRAGLPQQRRPRRGLDHRSGDGASQIHGRRSRPAHHAHPEPAYRAFGLAAGPAVRAGLGWRRRNQHAQRPDPSLRRRTGQLVHPDPLADDRRRLRLVTRPLHRS